MIFFIGNVSLINEPLKTPMHQQQQQSQNSQLQPQTVIGANGKIAQVTVQNKNVQIIHNQNQPQQVFSSTGQTQMMHNPQNILNQQMQQGNNVLNSGKPMNDSQQLNSNNNQQQQVVVNSNVLKFVELPKVQANQQLFSLNTITNEITQLNPNQTTAALGPMERLLIVPSGINAQQLAQCLSQGQIHFNNIGQVNPTTDPNKIQQQMQIQQQIQQQQMQLAIQQQNLQSQAKQNKPVVSVKEPKPRKGKAKKNKDEQKMIKPNSVKQNNVTHTLPMVNKVLDAKVPKVMSSPPALVSTSCSSTTTSLVNSKNTITISPTNSNTLVPIQKQTKAQATKPLPTLNPTKITTMHPKNNNNKVVMNNNSVQMPPHSQLVKPQTPNKQQSTTSNQNMTQQQQLSPISAPLPPLISVNTAPMPRVQTIQLTPQKQQSLKNVQMQIQQLSAKLKNKSLLATLTADVDPNNPIHNNPLPVLTNINNMSDNEIYNALQRLFVEQQKILATGKIIPTIPAAVSPRAIHMSASQGQPNTQSSQSTSAVSQGLSNNVQTIFTPKINPTTANSNNVVFAGKLQSNTPSLATSAIIKQEVVPTSTPSISISVPPPLVMPIKMENLMSPSSCSSSILSPPVCSTANASIGSPLVAQQNMPLYDAKSNHFVEIKTEFVPPLVAPSPKPLLIEADNKMKVTRSSL